MGKAKAAAGGATKFATSSLLRAKQELLRTISREALVRPSRRALQRATRKIAMAVDHIISRTLTNRTSSHSFGDVSDDPEASSYGSQQYWEQRYVEGKELETNFEWFLGFRDLEPLLRNVVDFDDRTAIFVDLGCGLSMFLRDLRRSGYKGQCVGVDYSENAIEKLRARPDCKGIDFKTCDVRTIYNIIKGASVALDKSLMDTMLHAKDESLVVDMLQAVAKSLREGSKFISVTQLDPRKGDDLAFLKDTILPNLRSTYLAVGKVTIHISGTQLDQDKPAPIVIIYDMVATDKSDPDNIAIDVIEYDSSEDSSSDIEAEETV